MKISAPVQNTAGRHHVTLSTNETVHSIKIPPKPTGFGSSANGGELLFLALATCYCNDIYREAVKRGIHVERVDVEVADEPARIATYRVTVAAQASEAEIRELMQHTDQVAEIQNTLGAGTPVAPSQLEIVKV